MYYVYINTNTCMYIFKKLRYVYILNVFIYNIIMLNIFVNIFKVYTVYVSIYICINKEYTYIYYVNKNVFNYF